MTLLHIILENAGADKGCLILEKNGQYFIEASDNSEDATYSILESRQVDNSLEIPQKIINYVVRSKEALVIRDAMADPLSNKDPYIIKHQCKSILCYPIIYQGDLIGLFYLENNLAVGAFVPARLELVKILSTQAAIALKNARLLAREQEKSQLLAESLEKLTQKEEQYPNIFEAASDGFVINDLETGQMLAANLALCQMYGYDTPEEFLQVSSASLIHPDSFYLLEEGIAAVKANQIFECESVGLKKDGTPFYIEVRASRCSYNGKLQLLSVVRDITARKRAELQIQQKNDQLKQALNKLQSTQSQLIQTEKISQLGQLVAGVAHEVNNPVGFISGNLTHASEYIEDLRNLIHLYQSEFPKPGSKIESKIEIIDLEYLLSDLPKMISSMKLGIDRIRDIMLSLRNYSRTDNSEKRVVDIHEGIDTTLLILSHKLKASSERPAIKIVKKYGDLPNIECYPGQINQVFMNLISNAIDSLDESSIGKKIF
ncbi:MAG: PAS domain S-box protein [Calothrix sp. SM1_7_51]|nr:PAS domain S-box protein [Calothrix sp. SM1_7_51]